MRKESGQSNKNITQQIWDFIQAQPSAQSYYLGMGDSTLGCFVKTYPLNADVSDIKFVHYFPQDIIGRGDNGVIYKARKIRFQNQNTGMKVISGEKDEIVVKKMEYYSKKDSKTSVAKQKEILIKEDAKQKAEASFSA